MRDPWTFALKFGDRPQCPGCGELLNSEASLIASGWLWCVGCVRSELSNASTIANILAKDWLNRHSTFSKGVYVYTPRDVRLKGRTVIEADLLLSAN